MQIKRDLASAESLDYDLIIIGGGVYGILLANEAAAIKLRVLLLEKDDFGGATSYNSLRIIHGGLRYLQSLNLKRHREFIKERAWFLRNYPGYVRQLPVLMPLYQRGMVRTDTFQIAFVLDHWLGKLAVRAKDNPVKKGKVISQKKVGEICEHIVKQGLRGGALWYDGSIPESQLWIMEVARQACAYGATLLNYVCAESIVSDSRGVKGVVARDVVSKQKHSFCAKKVVNLAGPWCREVAAAFDEDHPKLGAYSVAWNILFDRKQISDHALALSPPGPGAQMYVFHPWNGQLLIGTGHAPRAKNPEPNKPTSTEIESFIDDLNKAVPNLRLSKEEILHVYSGVIPVETDSALDFVKEDRLLDHGKATGIQGLYSLCGTKLTAAHSAATAILHQLYKGYHASEKKEVRSSSYDANKGRFDYHWLPTENESVEWRKELKDIIDKESVIHLDDLMLRRTTLGNNPVKAIAIAKEVAKLFDWEEERRRVEIERLKNHYHWIH